MYTFYPWPCSYTVSDLRHSEPRGDPRIRVAGEYGTFDFTVYAALIKAGAKPPTKASSHRQKPYSISYLWGVLSRLTRGSVRSALSTVWPQYIANTRRSLWQPVTLSLWGGQAERETREEPECQQCAD